MMAQYNAIKAQHPDALVMMRMSDCYEMVAAAFDGTAGVPTMPLNGV
jgi:DNA mismatch repair ATPase MutS